MEIKSNLFDIKSYNEQTGEFVGHASVYGVVDSYNEIVEKGAFSRTLERKGGKAPLLWQHNPDDPIGINELDDTDEALITKGRINLDVQRGREAHSLLKMGAVQGLSIGFQTVKDAWDGAVRKLKEVDLWEVSVVTFPANPMSNVTAVKRRMNGGLSLDMALLAIVGAGEVKAGELLRSENRDLVLKAHDVLGEILDGGGSRQPEEAQEIESLINQLKTEWGK